MGVLGVLVIRRAQKNLPQALEYHWCQFHYLTWFPAFSSLFFFFNDTATTAIYPLSLHAALPISGISIRGKMQRRSADAACHLGAAGRGQKDRKSTRLNSSHQIISYAVFCLK